MANEEVDELRDRLEEYVGKPMGPPSVAPDPVNVLMIRHWAVAGFGLGVVFVEPLNGAADRGLSARLLVRPARGDLDLRRLDAPRLRTRGEVAGW